jgi:tetratricopeptide (TPR) repeat protein
MSIALRRWPVWVAVLLALGSFAPASSGDFVYDDRSQILGNHLIQEPGYLAEALQSDVWSFKGERTEAWSHYWRPIFVASLILEYRIFGIESSVGWHLTNLLLHLVVIFLGDLWMRRIAVGDWVRAVSLAVFAVHPVHTESVVWISGSPDLLMSCFVLGCLIQSVPTHEARLGRWVPLSVAAYFALALLTKEAAITVPLLVAAQVLLFSTFETARDRLLRLVRLLVPMFVVVGVYIPTRIHLLGRFQIETPWNLSTWDLLLNAPQLLTFYLRQMLLPVVLGPSYSIRAATRAALDWSNFWRPLLVTLVFAVWLLTAIRRSRRVALALSLFWLILAPAFNIGAFLPEQITHDRYLYLPALGLVLAIALTLRSAWARFRQFDPKWLIALAALIIILLSTQTLRYSRVWMSEEALWRHAIRVDPSSAFNHAQLGHVLLEANNDQEALASLDRALGIAPVAMALVDRSEIFLRRGSTEEAEADARRVVNLQPDNYDAIIRLAAALRQQDRLPEAIDVLEAGRLNAPYRSCALTSNLAVLLVLKGDRGQAEQELLSIGTSRQRDRSPACDLVPFHLGSLYRERGDFEAAAREYQAFLDQTAGRESEELTPRKQLAATWLERYREQI